MALAGHCAQTFERARLFEAERAARAAADTARRELEALLDQLLVGVSVVSADGSVRLNAAAGAIWLTAKRRVRLLPLSLPLARAHVAPPRRPRRRARRAAHRARSRRHRTSSTRSCSSRAPTAASGASPPAPRRCATPTAPSTRRWRCSPHHRAARRRGRAARRAVRRNAAVRAPPTTSSGKSSPANHMHSLERAHARLRLPALRCRQASPRPLCLWIRAPSTPTIAPFCRAVGLEGAEKAAPRPGLASIRFLYADGSWVPTFDRCVFQRDESGAVRASPAPSATSPSAFACSTSCAPRCWCATTSSPAPATSCACCWPRWPRSSSASSRPPLDDERARQQLAAAQRQVGSPTLVDEPPTSRIVGTAIALRAQPARHSSISAPAVAGGSTRSSSAAARRSRSTRPCRWSAAGIDCPHRSRDHHLLTNALRYGERRPVKVIVGSAGDRPGHRRGPRPRHPPRGSGAHLRALRPRRADAPVRRARRRAVAVASGGRRARRAASPSRARPASARASPSSCRGTVNEPHAAGSSTSDLDVREAFTDLFEFIGWKVFHAADGQAALDWLEANPPPTVILLDLKMPRCDGYEFRRRSSPTRAGATSTDGRLHRRRHRRRAERADGPKARRWCASRRRSPDSLWSSSALTLSKCKSGSALELFARARRPTQQGGQHETLSTSRDAGPRAAAPRSLRRTRR